MKGSGDMKEEKIKTLWFLGTSERVRLAPIRDTWAAAAQDAVEQELAEWYGDVGVALIWLTPPEAYNSGKTFAIFRLGVDDDA